MSPPCGSTPKGPAPRRRARRAPRTGSTSSVRAFTNCNGLAQVTACKSRQGLGWGPQSHSHTIDLATHPTLGTASLARSISSTQQPTPNGSPAAAPPHRLGVRSGRSRPGGLIQAWSGPPVGVVPASLGGTEPHGADSQSASVRNPEPDLALPYDNDQPRQRGTGLLLTEACVVSPGVVSRGGRD
jgi:hypothetical protein